MALITQHNNLKTQNSIKRFIAVALWHATKLLSISVCFLNIATAQAAIGDMQFSNLTTADGLSHKTVTCFYQDKKGFVWIGTSNGLNRYDGYRFKWFFGDLSDSLAFNGNVIRELAEGANNTYWLTTINGFFSFNPRNETFRTIKIKGVSTFNTQNICTDGSGKVWCLVKNAFLLSIDSVSHKVKDKIDLRQLLGRVALGKFGIIQYYDNKIWISGDNGIMCYDVQNNKSHLALSNINRMFSFARYLKQGKTNNEIIAIDGNIGIYTVNTKTLQHSLLSIDRFRAVSPDLMYLTDAQYDAQGGLWVGAMPGLFYVSPQGTIQKVNHTIGASHNFDLLTVNCMYRDKEGNIWIGTMDNGAFIIKQKKNVFEHHSIISNKQRDLPVSALIVEKNTIMAGTITGTVLIDAGDNQNSQAKQQITPTQSVSITAKSADEAYIFTRNELILYNNKTKSKKTLWQPGNILRGFVDSRGIAWAMHWGYGMTGFDLKTGFRYKIDIDTIDRRNNVIYCATEDSDGSFWCGTFGTGLVHIEFPTSGKPRFTIYTSNKGPHAIKENVVLAIHDDERGALWLGTNGGGLNRFDKLTQQFEAFTIKNGLKNNVVEAVISDVDGNIWFTSNIVSKYDITKHAFTHFDASDGVTSHYFTGAAFRDGNGKLYFGDDAGILSFNPRTIRPKTIPKTPVFTGMRLFGLPVDTRQTMDKHVPFPISPDYAKELSLPYNLNTVSIEFASIQIPDNKAIVYQYQLEGVDNRWIRASSFDHSATYSGLQPGRYRFMVRASNGQEEWSAPRYITLEITPPWWKTLWFRLLALLCATIGLSYLFYLRIHAIQKQKRRLEVMVAERTVELQAASETLSQQAQSLQEQNTDLHEQKLMIEVKNQQLNEALTSKDKLIGIIAHDFKNPLSSVHTLSVMLRDNLQQFDTQKALQYLESIVSASDNLKTQMLSVLDWAQSQAQDLGFRSVEINIETLINDCVELVRESAQQKQISISTQFDFAANALIDPRMISTVLRNLLVNAIKFTARGGAISIVVQEYAEVLEVSVVDTGVGMTKQTVESIFDSAELTQGYGTENERGLGFGLQISKTFIEQNGGTITVRSTQNKGSVFSFTLRKGTELSVRRSKQQQFVTKAEQAHTPVVIASDKSQTILVIDDNSTMLTILHNLFDPYFTVITAADGEAGLQLAQNTVPSLIISDINMPNRDGISLCRVLKQDEMTCHIPIILLTSEEAHRNDGFAGGADDFIEKPFNNQAVLLKVVALLENRKRLHTQLQSKTDKNGFIMPESFNDKIMQKVFAYINANFTSSDIDINQVAEHIGLSRSQLWRKFKASTGQNMSDYVQELRLQKAHEMLDTGKYKVAEVAYDVGFTNPQYFTRSFSARFGESPKDCIDRAKKG